MAKQRAFLKKDAQSRRSFGERHHLEQRLRQQGYQRIVGVDEAGRGALAGPVVAAAVVLPHGCEIDGLDDSKQLTPIQREKLFEAIHGVALAIGVGAVNNQEIDRINILQATLEAMRQAVQQISPLPDYVLVDGTHLPHIPIAATAIPKGDSLIPAIAAASIIAKVTRDAKMTVCDEHYPHYGFQKHKGYGTIAHRQAISQLGPCPIHRRSFKLC